MDYVWYVKGLSAGVIADIPNLDHAFGITGNEGV